MARIPADRHEDLGGTTVKAVKDEFSKYVAKVIITTAAGAIGLAGLGLWLYVKTILPDIAGGVPSGAVMAFDLPKGCPTGWTTFEQAAGRTVIGTATAQQASANSVIVHGYRDNGGQETHKLTEAELPPLKFSFTVNAAENNSAGDRLRAGGADYFVVVRTPTPITLSSAGKGDTFPTMPPYVALFYCKKD
jgi:hypothetical protein